MEVWGNIRAKLQLHPFSRSYEYFGSLTAPTQMHGELFGVLRV
jgi:hypothetical protein